MLLKLSDLKEDSSCRRWLLTQEITTDQNIETKYQWNLQSIMRHLCHCHTPPPKGEAPLVKKKLDDCNKTNPECCLPDKT